MTTVEYESASGRNLTLGQGRLHLLEVTGLETPPSSVAVIRGAAGMNPVATSPRNEPRTVRAIVAIDLEGLDTIEVATECKAVCEALVMEKEPGVLTIGRYGRTRQIDAIPAMAPEFLKKPWNEKWQKLKLAFSCTKLHFKDSGLTTSEIRFFENQIEFGELGVEFPEEGIEVATILNSGNRITTILNNGNVPAPVRILFTGPILNPFIRNNTTGDTLRISKLVGEDEYLEIDTEQGRRQILLWQNGEAVNGMHYLDMSSRFWSLEPGINVIEIGDESPGEGSKAYFEFFGRYLEA